MWRKCFLDMFSEISCEWPTQHVYDFNLHLASTKMLSTDSCTTNSFLIMLMFSADAPFCSADACFLNDARPTDIQPSNNTQTNKNHRQIIKQVINNLDLKITSIQHKIIAYIAYK